MAKFIDVSKRDMMKKGAIYTILLSLLTGCHELMGQTTFQVVTKTITKSFPYKEGAEFNIEGERAEIQVETWSKNEVKVVLELVSKHTSRKTAEADLAKMKYSSAQHGNKIYFRNNLTESSSGKETESDLKAIYTITLPANCPLYLKNNYGVASVINLSKEVRINSEFSKIYLENLKGKLGINSFFGDIEGHHLEAIANITSRRSDITLHDIRGNWNINSQFGVLKFFTNPSPELLLLNIDAEKSDVYFFDPKPNAYGYTLTAHYGNITVPRDLKFNFLTNSDQLKKAVFSSKLGSSNISIKISFGDIVIRNP
jgi:hypothetical protein